MKPTPSAPGGSPLQTFRLSAAPLPAGYGASSHSPAASPIRAAVRSAIREENDPVRRVARELVREELAAANPTPVQRMKAAVSDAVALSADRTERKAFALSAVRGLGVGLRPDDLTALARETAETIGCGFSEAVLSLSTEDAR